MNRYTKHGLFVGSRINHKRNPLRHLQEIERKAYRAWVNLTNRCVNKTHPAYQNYGGRGITVCGRWRGNYMTFIGDMGYPPDKSMSIGRIDNNKGYSPKNCRWEDQKQQCRNYRYNVFITINGVRKCLKDWANYCGVSSTCMTYRIKNLPRGRWLKSNVKRTNITIDGKTRCVAEWAKIAGVSATCLHYRIKIGVRGKNLLYSGHKGKPLIQK